MNEWMNDFSMPHSTQEGQKMVNQMIKPNYIEYFIYKCVRPLKSVHNLKQRHSGQFKKKYDRLRSVYSSGI